MMYDLFDKFMEWVCMPFMMLLILALPVGCAVGIYQESKAETFALRKDSWGCTARHTETSTSYVQTGSVMVPVTSSSTVCDQWSRR